MTNLDVSVLKTEPIKALRSEKSTKVCYVRFVNMSERFVEVLWINYKGIKVRYKVMLPKRSYDATTFETHPWVFRDHYTQQYLCVNSSNVYYAHQRSVPLDPPQLEDGVLVTSKQVRVMARIHIIAYPLKELCLCVIRSHLKSKDCVSELDIPQTLKDDLTDLWPTFP